MVQASLVSNFGSEAMLAAHPMCLQAFCRLRHFAGHGFLGAGVVLSMRFFSQGNGLTGAQKNANQWFLMAVVHGMLCVFSVQGIARFRFFRVWLLESDWC